MSRVKITMPSNFIYSTTLQVRVTDLNYGNHLANDKLLGLIHQARVLFLEKYNFTELNCAKVGLIMADLAVEYKKEAFLNQELNISICAANFSRVSFDLYYLVTTNNDVIAKVKTGMVCYDYSSKSVVSVPADLISLWVEN